MNQSLKGIILEISSLKSMVCFKRCGWIQVIICCCESSLFSIGTCLLSNKSRKTRRNLTTTCLKYVDWTLNNNIFNQFTEKLKFCNAFYVASSIMIRVVVLLFDFMDSHGFCSILQWLSAAYHCTACISLCSVWGNEMTESSGEN